jgi:uncharacterized protein (DUF433 family)
MNPDPAFPRITIDPLKLSGKPCIRGMRISVQDVLRALADYPTHAELLAEYPDLESGDLVEAAAFASVALDRALSAPPSIDEEG